MKQEKQKEDVCRAILLAVYAHPACVGVDSLALVLKGSRSKRLMMRKLHESRFFGSLFYYTTDVIANFIKQCMQLGFLATFDMGVSSYPTPVLVLTEAGRKLLATDEVIPLATIKNKAEKKLTPVVEETCSLIKQLKSVEAVAKQRGIAVSTAYDYLSRGIQFGIIDVDAVVSKEVQQQIKAALKDTEERVKEIKERLPEEISYGEIMCVLANIRPRYSK